jgi:hypothetical protein
VEGCIKFDFDGAFKGSPCMADKRNFWESKGKVLEKFLFSAH